MKDVLNFSPWLHSTRFGKRQEMLSPQMPKKRDWWLGNHGQRMRVSPVWSRSVVSVLISDDIPSVIRPLHCEPTTESGSGYFSSIISDFRTSNRLEYNTIAPSLTGLFCFIVNWLWNFEVMNRSFETLNWLTDNISPMLLRCSLDKSRGVLCWFVD